MSNVAELLEWKQTLLERLQDQPDSEQLAEIERRLQDINEALNKIELDDLKHVPIAPR